MEICGRTGMYPTTLAHDKTSKQSDCMYVEAKAERVWSKIPSFGTTDLENDTRSCIWI